MQRRAAIPSTSVSFPLDLETGSGVSGRGASLVVFCSSPASAGLELVPGPAGASMSFLSGSGRSPTGEVARAALISLAHVAACALRGEAVRDALAYGPALTGAKPPAGFSALAALTLFLGVESLELWVAGAPSPAGEGARGFALAAACTLKGGATCGVFAFVPALTGDWPPVGVSVLVALTPPLGVEGLELCLAGALSTRGTIEFTVLVN
jgi:hypothetical protein